MMVDARLHSRVNMSKKLGHSVRHSLTLKIWYKLTLNFAARTKSRHGPSCLAQNLITINRLLTLDVRRRSPRPHWHRLPSLLLLLLLLCPEARQNKLNPLLPFPSSRAKIIEFLLDNFFLWSLDKNVHRSWTWQGDAAALGFKIIAKMVASPT